MSHPQPTQTVLTRWPPSVLKYCTACVFVLSVDSLYLSVLIMSNLRMTKTALCFYFRTLAHISISALCAPLSLSVAFVKHVWMSNDTFDLHRILSVVLRDQD